MARFAFVAVWTLAGMSDSVAAQTIVPPYNLNPPPNYTQPPPPPLPPPPPTTTIPGTNIYVTPTAPPSNNSGNLTTISPGGMSQPLPNPSLNPAPATGAQPGADAGVTISIPQ